MLCVPQSATALPCDRSITDLMNALESLVLMFKLKAVGKFTFYTIIAN